MKIKFRYADTGQAAVYLGMSIGALYNLVNTRQIPYKRRGRKLIFDLQELDAYNQQLSGVGLDEAVKRTKNNGLLESKEDKKGFFNV